MSRFERLLNRFLKNPDSIKFKKIEKILLHLKFQKAGIKGSHHTFSHPLIHQTFSIPVHSNDCKKVYKKEIAKLIIENLNLLEL